MLVLDHLCLEEGETEGGTLSGCLPEKLDQRTSLR